MWPSGMGNVMASVALLSVIVAISFFVFLVSLSAPSRSGQRRLQREAHFAGEIEVFGSDERAFVVEIELVGDVGSHDVMVDALQLMAHEDRFLANIGNVGGKHTPRLR